MVSSKYQLLALHLEKSDQDMLRMTFKEVEARIQGKLPAGAFEHRAWWANSETHAHARHGWMNVGYETSSVNMEGRELVFLRAPSRVIGFYKEEIAPAHSRPAPRSPAPQSRRRGRSSELQGIVRAAGGAQNLAQIARAIQQYIDGDLLETELGRILRKLWPRI